MKNNKILLYSGGALFLGVTAFFVWSFFKKSKAPLDEKNILLDYETSNDDKIDYTKYFSELPTEFAPITTPKINRDLQSMI